MTSKQLKASHRETHRAFFREVLSSVRRLMTEKYRLREVTIRPMGSGGSRLSIPIKITGVNAKGEKVRYFGKILGSSDILSSRSIQFFKNVYLRMNAQDPIFGASETAEEMARHQFEMMQAIHNSGIPTAKPLGYHWINGIMWLVVAEFLEVEPVSSIKEVDPEKMDMAFRHMRLMHRKKIFHGDIKPDNILLGDEIYIIDVGRFRDDVLGTKKLAYDLACMISSFLDRLPAEVIVAIAKKHYLRRQLRDASDYIELVQRRPDIHFTDDTKTRLIHLLRS